MRTEVTVSGPDEFGRRSVEWTDASGRRYVTFCRGVAEFWRRLVAVVCGRVDLLPY